MSSLDYTVLKSRMIQSYYIALNSEQQILKNSKSMVTAAFEVESSWNVLAHNDTWEGKWRGNWRMEWVALHTTLEHGVFSITTADAHTSYASSKLNWCPHRFKWTRPFRQKTKSGFCACTITFKLASTTAWREWRKPKKISSQDS